MLSCISFRKRNNKIKNLQTSVKEEEKKDIKFKVDDEMNKPIILSSCEPVINNSQTLSCEHIQIVEGNIIPANATINPDCVTNKPSIIMNIIEKEYTRLENIRNKRDALTDLPGNCNSSDIVYQRNLYIQNELKILDQIESLLKILK